MKFMKLGSLQESAEWTFRSWQHGFPVAIENVGSWTMKADVFDAVYDEELRTWDGTWRFLAPFFESRGYHLYSLAPGTRGYTHLPPSGTSSSKETDSSDPYPYARRAYQDEDSVKFFTEHRPRLRPARDVHGREVIIRMVSGPSESEELKALRRLNSPQARADARNHTLPVIEFLNFDGLIFVVMPRWDDRVFGTHIRFSKISEYFDVAEMLFEGLEFLHEHRIAHRDIFESNTVLNLIMGHEHRFGLGEPGKVKYAFIDWDSALVLPEETDTSTVLVERLMRRPAWNLGMTQGMCNPFKDDVRFLATFLERWIRHLQHVVPDFGEWFDDMLFMTDEWLPPASDWLAELRRIRSTVPQSIMESEPLYVAWRDGKALTRVEFGCRDH